MLGAKLPSGGLLQVGCHIIEMQRNPRLSHSARPIMIMFCNRILDIAGHRIRFVLNAIHHQRT